MANEQTNDQEEIQMRLDLEELEKLCVKLGLIGVSASTGTIHRGEVVGLEMNYGELEKYEIDPEGYSAIVETKIKPFGWELIDGILVDGIEFVEAARIVPINFGKV